MPVDLEQLRASRAFAAANEARPGGAAEFLGTARRLPEMLRTNGLLAAWAYLLAKENGEAGRRKVRESLAAHLENRFGEPARALGKLFAGDPPAEPLPALELQRLAAEAVTYAGWLKRAAEAVCDTGEAGADTAAAEAGEST